MAAIRCDFKTRNNAMLEQGLHLKINQQLSITPQLQQAIRLLQLSSLELQQEIQLALEHNPLLEIAFPEFEYEPFQHSEFSAEKEDYDEENTFQDDIPAEKTLDACWEQDPTTPATLASSSDIPSIDIAASHSAHNNLHEHLLLQVYISPFTEKEIFIAKHLIDAINTNGYISEPLHEIYLNIRDNDITFTEVQSVLQRIQQFEPCGVGAQTLQECLQLQLTQLDPVPPYYAETLDFINHHLTFLETRDIQVVMQEAKLDKTTFSAILNLLKSLDPYPGLRFHTVQHEYIIPDIIVRKGSEGWHTELNPSVLPKLTLNSYYASLKSSPLLDPQESNFIQTHLQEAKWLIKSLESRNETLLKVASCIVEQQEAFFEQGEEYMKPMTLSDIANKVEMHESTISRITTQKFLHSSRGMFELKFFFSSRFQTESGDSTSSIAIRALIKKLIAGEDPKKPLSDNKLSSILEQQGILVARRTVTKYRESLFIPASNQRKQCV